MKTPSTLFSGALIAALSIFLGHSASGGTVNIDFQPGGGGVVTETTRGLLGTGTTWNAVSADVAGGPGAGLLDENGAVTQVGVATLAPAAYVFDIVTGPPVPPYTGANRLQQDGLVNTTNAPYNTGGTTLTMTIGFLRGGESYRLVYYNGATGGIVQTITANGVVAVCNSRTDPPPALPGTAGVDHVVLNNVVANGSGDIVITVINAALDTGTCAGLQIQGWFDGEPLANARRADSAVSRRSGSGFKGDNQYTPGRTGGQTLTRRGKRARFFFRVENDGNTFGDFSARGTRTNRSARRRYLALAPNENVTAAIGRGAFTTALEPGESRVVRAIVRSRRSRARIHTDFRSMVAGIGEIDRATGRLRR